MMMMMIVIVVVGEAEPGAVEMSCQHLVRCQTSSHCTAEVTSLEAAVGRGEPTNWRRYDPSLVLPRTCRPRRRPESRSLSERV